MSLHKNRVKMTVAGTYGTGTVTLGSASTAYQSFASAYGANATVDVLYTDASNAWGIERDCAYTHSVTTLGRGTYEASSTGGNLSLTSAAVVSVILSAGKGNNIEAALQSVTPGGRLTLESGVPVSTEDRTAKTSVYYTPYVHNIINLWDGTNWVPTTFTEKTLALGTITSARPYDVFGYLSAGALVLELLAWTSDTARATAVTLQDGRYCKSGDKTRLLLGSFYTTSTTTTEDSQLKRYLSNVYNTVARRLAETDSGSHAYAMGTWHEWNSGTGVDRLQFVSALAANTVELYLAVNLQRTGAGTVGYTNIGYDATDGTNNLLSNMEAYAGGTGSFALSGTAVLSAPIGKHYATVVEYGTTSVTYAAFSFYGVIKC
jgi:hypothetical protein